MAAVEAELLRLKEERGVEADELASMLVRMAESERARVGAEQRAEALCARERELEEGWDQARREVEALRAERQRAVEATDLAAQRAELAERSAADGAASLERARADLEADRVRLTELEAKLGRLRREHADELTAMRLAHADARADADLHAARRLEEERAATARARAVADAAHAELARARDRLARAATLVEEMERREEMAGALRARALEQARAVLAGEASEPPPELVPELDPDAPRTPSSRAPAWAPPASPPPASASASPAPPPPPSQPHSQSQTPRASPEVPHTPLDLDLDVPSAEAPDSA